MFVRRGADVLVVLRAPEAGGYWHVVGGGVEPGETDEEAALRELREETGLEVDGLDAIGGFRYGEGVVSACFVAHAPRDWEPQLDHEHTEYRWCSREEADALLRWPEPRALLAAVLGNP